MIGVDIGGTNLLVGRIEREKVVERLHQPIAARGDFEVVVRQTCNAIRELSEDNVEPVGISVAGSVDASNGIVLRAQNLNWDDAPLANAVSSELGRKVVIENDVTAAAWGEFKFGSGRGANSLFAVWIGTGIGGGLILNKQIWRGSLGTGGEFGMGISEHNPNAEHRVLESYSSRSGFQHLLQNPSLDTQMLESLYGEDDAVTKMIQSGAKRIGTSIANVITLLSLERVVLGGGLIEALGDSFVEVIRKQFESDVFPPHCKQCQFKTTELGPDAGLLGVTALATE